MIGDVLEDLLSGVPADHRQVVRDWWNRLTAAQQEELSSLWPGEWNEVRFLSFADRDANTDFDLADDYYEYLVDHEFKAPLAGFLDMPQWSPVTAVPLLSPHWPPYEADLYDRPWEPNGEVARLPSIQT